MIKWVKWMARKGRIKSGLGIYHAVLRGQKNLFFDDKDYLAFVNTLKRYFLNTDSLLYAYSFENNKVHLVFFTPGEISDVMKPLLTSYARYINRTYNKKGKLFYDRYMSEPIDDVDLLTKAIIFVNEQNAVTTSKDEYLKKADLCALSRLDKNSIEEIKNPSYVYPFIDDYASMSDNELKKYILSTGTAKKQELSENALLYSNLSKTRVKKVLNLTKEINKKPVEKPKKEPQKNKNNELSVWLL